MCRNTNSSLQSLIGLWWDQEVPSWWWEGKRAWPSPFWIKRLSHKFFSLAGIRIKTIKFYTIKLTSKRSCFKLTVLHSKLFCMLLQEDKTKTPHTQKTQSNCVIKTAPISKNIPLSVQGWELVTLFGQKHNDKPVQLGQRQMKYNTCCKPTRNAFSCLGDGFKNLQPLWTQVHIQAVTSQKNILRFQWPCPKMLTGSEQTNTFLLQLSVHPGTFVSVILSSDTELWRWNWSQVGVCEMLQECVWAHGEKHRALRCEAVDLCAPRLGSRRLSAQPVCLYSAVAARLTDTRQQDVS